MTKRPSHNASPRSIRAGGVRALLLTLASLAAILGLSLVASGHQALADDPTIKIANFTFDPPTLTIKAGTTVTWVNADDIPHLVSEKDGKFRSSALDTDEKFSQTLYGRVFLRDPSENDGKHRRHALKSARLAKE